MRREEWARQRRREMLAAYYQVLKDEGLQGASIAKIAKRIDAPRVSSSTTSAPRSR